MRKNFCLLVLTACLFMTVPALGSDVNVTDEAGLIAALGRVFPSPLITNYFA